MKRVLVLCPGPWDKTMLARPDIAAKYSVTFAAEELYDIPPLWKALTFDVHEYIEALTASVRPQGFEGVVGTGDYPACLLAAELGQRLSLPSPRPREVVLFSHKYYSRQIQQQIVPRATPAYVPVDPGRPHRARDLEKLRYPLFVKPVKGTMSIRARAVVEQKDLRGAVRLTLRDRFRAHLLLRPFQQLLDQHSDGRVRAHFFIAEEMLRGRQVTVDGFVEKGTPRIMGVVDSVMYPGTMSFMRFDHPSTLPVEVQERMSEIAADLMKGSGFDNSCFNIEMFYDPDRDAIHIIEVNPRMSYQFGDLYEKVDGTNTYEIQLQLATGAPARWVPRSGIHGAAASFVMRRFSDAIVDRVPSAEAIAELKAKYPDAVVKVLVKPGDRMSEHDQDVGSYRYAIVNLGAPDRTELFRRWAEAEQLLKFSFR